MTDGNRPRNQYHITKKGLADLENWMEQPIDLSHQRDEMQLKLFVGGHKNKPTVIKLIENFRTQQNDRLQILESELAEILPSVPSGILPEQFEWLEPQGTDESTRKRAVQEQALIFQLSIRQGMLKAPARITWCDEASALLKNPSFFAFIGRFFSRLPLCSYRIRARLYRNGKYYRYP
jgi:hypothetical protein